MVCRRACDGRLKAFEIAPDLKQKTLTGFRQCELARAALKQADSEIPLQHRDVPADCSRR